MASVTLTLLLLLLISATYAQHYSYYGGSVAFTPKGRDSNGAYEVELRNKQTSVVCYQDGYTCYYGDCGSETQSTSTLIANNSYGLEWCQYETVTKIQVNSSLPFAIRYPDIYNTTLGEGYWNENDKQWGMLAHVDLGTRSDTGQCNRPPITSVLPLIRVPRNCPRSFNLTVFDPDGDQVRCRVPTDPSTYECKLCDLPSDFSFDEDSCSLTFLPGYSGEYQIELMLEDFPSAQITVTYSDGTYGSKQPLSEGRHKRDLPSTTEVPTVAETTTVADTTTIEETTTTATPLTTVAAASSTSFQTASPLSKLPVQFSVLVDNDAPSCLDGDFIPIFLTPTPSNGVNLFAFVNNTLKIEVRTSAQYATINDLIVTGPSGISKQRISTEEFLIQWTPTENELDDHFPICFVSEAKTSDYNSVFHSELRCVIVDVGHREATVTCSQTTIMVEVKKDYLIRQNENNLHLNDPMDPSCNLATSSNTTHLVAVMSLNTCGTIIEEDDNNIIFKNQITSAHTNETISRTNDVEIVFLCVYPKRANMIFGFTHKNPYVFSEQAFGTFTFQFEFYDSQLFQNQIGASSYPVEVDLKQMIFMQIEANTSTPSVELFLESCRATPYDNPNASTSYSIIENGCVKDNTVQIYSTSESQFKFGMEAFEFIGDYPEVYITCTVILCETGVPGTRCSQGCLPSNSRDKRDVTAQTSKRAISQGPLYLVKASASKASGSGLKLGLNVIFIVGCLLICAAVIFKSRRSKAKASAIVYID